MPTLSSGYSQDSTSSRDVNRLLYQDVASLLITSELISSSLLALRPECNFSSELTSILECMIDLCDSADDRLRLPLIDAKVTLPAMSDSSGSALVTGFFTRLPSADDQEFFAAEVRVNLQLLTQHVELKARLAADEALLAGLYELNGALGAWAAEWKSWGQTLRVATMRARAQSHVMRNELNGVHA